MPSPCSLLVTRANSRHCAPHPCSFETKMEVVTARCSPKFLLKERLHGICLMKQRQGEPRTAHRKRSGPAGSGPGVWQRSGTMPTRRMKPTFVLKVEKNWDHVVSEQVVEILSMNPWQSQGTLPCSNIIVWPHLRKAGPTNLGGGAKRGSSHSKF